MIGLGLILLAKILLDGLSTLNQDTNTSVVNNNKKEKVPRTLRKYSNISLYLKFKRLCSFDENINYSPELFPQTPRINNLGRQIEKNNNYLENEIKDVNIFLEINVKEIEELLKGDTIPSNKLETILGDEEKGVIARRHWIEERSGKNGVLKKLPFTRFDYKQVTGACCENVIGYVPVPLGVVGPLLLNGKQYYVPMATTEGCLVASTNRGCKALLMSGGVTGTVYVDGMTRGPVIHFPSAMRAVEAMEWLKKDEVFEQIKQQFDSTSSFAKLKRIQSRAAGRYLYIRFVGSTGDAMGMNMMSKGTERALKILIDTFPDIERTCLSGNYCTDKKVASLNWIEGRGKTAVCEAIISSQVIKKVLKTSIKSLVELNISKNLIGSSVAGTVGGYNAHAANVVAAIFIACGQDPAQVVSSSNCMTLMEKRGNFLWVSCTMPSIEVGTIGGGTVLNAQSACLQLLGVNGSSPDVSGNNARELGSIICATVMAGELSLMSALSSGHLVEAHMKHNRSQNNLS